MPVTFSIPGPLRSFAAGQSQVRIDRSPTTLAEALDELSKQCPGIRHRLLTEQGEIRPHINVFVGKEDIRYTGGLRTAVPDGAEIAIIPAISGGSSGALRPGSMRKTAPSLTNTINQDLPRGSAELSPRPPASHLADLPIGGRLHGGRLAHLHSSHPDL